MALSRPLLLCAALALAGCGGLANSVVNPMNWFGKARSQNLDPRAVTNPLIPKRSGFSKPIPVYNGQPVGQITGLKIERKPGGAMVLVTAVADTLGPFNVRLEAENRGRPVDGVLTYTLKAERPIPPQGVGRPAARTFRAAQALTDQDLRDVRKVVVKGARNQMVTRRR